MSEIFVEVLLDQNITKPLDYAVPQEWADRIEVGMRVAVPLRKELKNGIISKIKSTSLWATVKPVSQILSNQGELSEPLWKPANWMAHYYCAPLQKVCKCFLPMNVRQNVQQKTKIRLKMAKSHDETIEAAKNLRAKAPAQALVLDQLLASPKGIFLKDLPSSGVSALIKKKWVYTEKVIDSDDLLVEEEFFPTLAKRLNEEQAACLTKIRATLEKKSFAAHLIYGVTGSGKTEVYMQAIQSALDQNRSAIMLVPEISLTSQTIERFKARFSEKIAILHHRRSHGERRAAWEFLRQGKARIAIGARSAIFCPIQNLGLIIVDEEHDGSYKQSDETPSYHGRDVAVMRGLLENCTVLLGSATPSLESRYNAEIGKYQLHTLQSRANLAPMPKVQIIDMKRAMEITGGFTHFSPELIEALQTRFKKGEQSLIFLNKRGYHRMHFCASCRHIVKCPHCDLSLTYHQKANYLQCHLCDFQQPLSRQCPSCKSTDALEFKGFGTEHVEKSLHAIFPEIRTLRMDRDTTRQKNSHEELFKQFRAHKADVLIGTQMIAKGFHFPLVTLVGVLNTDATLSLPDFRAPEQVFQLLTQVAGRAGRDQLPGDVIIQTFMPEHPTLHLAAKQDYAAFYNAAIEDRKAFGYPPFSHLIKLRFSHENPEEAKESAEKAHAYLKATLLPPTEILPIAAAGHAKIKDLYRYQFVIKTNKVVSVTEKLKVLGTNVKIDVDPLSTFF